MSKYRPKADAPEKILNLRDAGGYHACDNRMLRKRMLFRSGMPDKASGHDLELLQELGLKTIFDLRPEKEWVRFPRGLEQAERIHLQVDITGTTLSRVRPFLHKKNTETEILNAVSSVYDLMVTLFIPHLPLLFSKLSMKETYPVLFHCRGGKDRTGVVIALIHHLLGISPDDILKDYLLTNDYLLPRARKTMKKINLFAFGLLPVRNYEIAYAAQEVYLKAFTERMMLDYGSPASYLTSNGVPPEHIGRLQSILLESQQG